MLSTTGHNNQDSFFETKKSMCGDQHERFLSDRSVCQVKLYLDPNKVLCFTS